jgi:hypothetical protein
MTGAVRILATAIQPEAGGMSPTLAEEVLRFDFPPRVHELCDALSAKASAGTLTEEEGRELEELLVAGDILGLLKAKARASLRHQAPAA